MSKIGPDQKKHPAFPEASAGQPPGQPGPILTQISPKCFVSLSFSLYSPSAATGRWERIKKTLALLAGERIKKTLAPFWPKCFLDPDQKTRSYSL